MWVSIRLTLEWMMLIFFFLDLTLPVKTQKRFIRIFLEYLLG